MPSAADFSSEQLLDSVIGISAAAEPQLRGALVRLFGNLAEDPTLLSVLKAIADGETIDVSTLEEGGEALSAIIDTLDASELLAITKRVYERVARATIDTIGVDVSFDLTNPESVSYARQLSGRLVTNIEQITRDSIRDVVVDVLNNDMTLAQMRRFIKQRVGLLPTHAMAVRNYESALMGSMAASKVATLVGQYANRLLNFRVDMIARTEIAAAQSYGQLSVWTQFMRDGIIPPSTMRIWMTAQDERVCDYCGPMHLETAPVYGLWHTPIGSVSIPTDIHPNCRCASGLIFPEGGRASEFLRKGPSTGYDWHILSSPIAKHLPGQHDQSSHGSWAKGRTPKRTTEKRPAQKRTVEQSHDVDAPNKYWFDLLAAAIDANLLTKRALFQIKTGLDQVLGQSDAPLSERIKSLSQDDSEQYWASWGLDLANHLKSGLATSAAKAMVDAGITADDITQIMDLYGDIQRAADRPVGKTLDLQNVNLTVKDLLDLRRADLLARERSTSGAEKGAEAVLSRNAYEEIPQEQRKAQLDAASTLVKEALSIARENGLPVSNALGVSPIDENNIDAVTDFEPLVGFVQANPDLILQALGSKKVREALAPHYSVGIIADQWPGDDSSTVTYRLDIRTKSSLMYETEVPSNPEETQFRLYTTGSVVWQTDDSFINETSPQLLKSFASKAIHAWAVSSGSTGSRLLMRAVDSQFGSVNRYDVHDATEHAIDTIAKSRPEAWLTTSKVYQAIVAAQYEQTQKLFKATGVGHVVLSRGVKLEPSSLRTQDGETVPAGFVSWPKDVYTDSPRHYERKARPAIGNVSQRSLTSWAAGTSSSLSFAGGATFWHPGERGWLMFAKVPVERIYSTPLTGPGCWSEQEMLVISGPLPDQVLWVHPDKYNAIRDTVDLRMIESGSIDLPTFELFQEIADAVTKAAESLRVDDDPINADWIKTIAFDLPVRNADEYMTFFGLTKESLPQHLATVMPMPFWIGVPDTLKAELLQIEISKHLPGQHDQKSHGSWAKGRTLEMSSLDDWWLGVINGMRLELGIPDGVEITLSAYGTGVAEALKKKLAAKIGQALKDGGLTEEHVVHFARQVPGTFGAAGAFDVYNYRDLFTTSDITRLLDANIATAEFWSGNASVFDNVINSDAEYRPSMVRALYALSEFRYGGLGDRHESEPVYLNDEQISFVYKAQDGKVIATPIYWGRPDADRLGKEIDLTAQQESPGIFSIEQRGNDIVSLAFQGLIDRVGSMANSDMHDVLRRASEDNEFAKLLQDGNLAFSAEPRAAPGPTAGKVQFTFTMPSKSATAVMGQGKFLIKVGGESALHESVASAMIGAWANSSGSYGSRLMMRAVGRLTGAINSYDPENLSERDIDKIEQAPNDFVSPFYDIAARTIYESTQDMFRSSGITHVVLARGLIMSGFVDDASGWPGLQKQILDSGYDRTEVNMVAGPVAQRTLSSWSTSYEVSRNDFSNGPVMLARVPVERIFATPLTGQGSLSEREMVVISGPNPDQIMWFWLNTEDGDSVLPLSLRGKLQLFQLIDEAARPGGSGFVEIPTLEMFGNLESLMKVWRP